MDVHIKERRRQRRTRKIQNSVRRLESLPIAAGDGLDYSVFDHDCRPVRKLVPSQSLSP